MIASDLLRAARLRRAAVRRTARGDRRARPASRASATRSTGRRSTPAMPNLLEEDELERGNALFQTVENMAWAVGPIIGGAIVAVSGTHAAYWINAASFVFSALADPADPGAPAPVGGADQQGALARHRATGSSFARRSPALQVMLVAWSVEMLAVACVERRRGGDREGLLQRGRLRLRAALRRRRASAWRSEASSAACSRERRAGRRPLRPGDDPRGHRLRRSRRSPRTSGSRRRRSSSPGSAAARRRSTTCC